MEEETQKKVIADKATALVRAEHFCAYQERSQHEVRDKLYALGLKSREVEEVIATLIKNNFLNEERFAIAYSLGKFRIKHWGRLKIKQGLKMKQVPDKLISKALAKIDPSEYLDVLKTTIGKKAAFLKEVDGFRKRQKLVQYAAGRGFEKDLIFDLLNASDLE